MNQCTVSNNATKGYASEGIIYAKDSSLTITDTDFINNDTVELPDNIAGVDTCLFMVRNSDLNISGGTITQNGGRDIFYFYDSMADIKDVTITDNTACVMYINNGNELVNVTDCTIEDNGVGSSRKTIRIENEGTLTVTDCILGDTTFNKPEYIKIMTSDVSREDAVIGIELLHTAETVSDLRFTFERGFGVFDKACPAEETDRFQAVEAFGASGGRQNVRRSGAEVTDGFRSPLTEEDGTGGSDEFCSSFGIGGVYF
jgi:hypothetical protein